MVAFQLLYYAVILNSSYWLCIDFKGRFLIKVMKFSRNWNNSLLDRLISSYMGKMDSGKLILDLTFFSFISFSLSWVTLGYFLNSSTWYKPNLNIGLGNGLITAFLLKAWCSFSQSLYTLL